MTEQLMDTLSNEEHEHLLLMSEHAIEPPLSPAAQAVLDAATEGFWSSSFSSEGNGAAAVLRAAVKYTKKQKVLRTLGVPMVKSPVYCLESALLAIADELEGL